jgi:hypothetical protein
MRLARYVLLLQGFLGTMMRWHLAIQAIGSPFKGKLPWNPLRQKRRTSIIGGVHHREVLLGWRGQSPGRCGRGVAATSNERYGSRG